MERQGEREQYKRKSLVNQELTRQKLEGSWLEWEKEKKQKKIKRKAQEKETASQAQLAYILQQNEKADRNLDLHNSTQMYTTSNKLLKKQMIGWDRSKN